jgi:hypothetical protein
MPYEFKGETLSLPLTVESIERWIEEKKKSLDLEDLDNPTNLFILKDLMFELYRDVLVVVRSRASHSAALAEAALKLEDVLK